MVNIRLPYIYLILHFSLTALSLTALSLTAQFLKFVIYHQRAKNALAKKQETDEITRFSEITTLLRSLR